MKELVSFKRSIIRILFNCAMFILSALGLINIVYLIHLDSLSFLSAIDSSARKHCCHLKGLDVNLG